MQMKNDLTWRTMCWLKLRTLNLKTFINFDRLHAVLCRRFTKGNQKPGAPSGDAEQSATPRRGWFKRLQDKMKTPGQDSPRACLTVCLKLFLFFDIFRSIVWTSDVTKAWLC